MYDDDEGGEEVVDDDDDGVGEDDDDFDGSTVVASGRTSGDDGGESADANDDDEYEVVVEEDGEDDVVATGGNDDGVVDPRDTRSSPPAASEGNGGPGGNATLRAVCEGIPRFFGGGANRTRKGRRAGGRDDNDVRTDDIGATAFKNDEGETAVDSHREDSEGEAAIEARDAGDAECDDDSPNDRLGRHTARAPRPPPFPPPEDHPLPVGPQVTFDESGFIVIDRDTLLPNPDSRQSTSEIDAELGTEAIVDEGESSCRLGVIQARHDSYVSKPRTVPVRWTPRETRGFYDALRQCGTDFGLMQMYCTGRTRMQLKRKFKVESRKNARLIDMALDPKCKVRLGECFVFSGICFVALALSGNILSMARVEYIKVWDRIFSRPMHHTRPPTSRFVGLWR